MVPKPLFNFHLLPRFFGTEKINKDQPENKAGLSK
jgi:hypothetical protein